MSPPALSPDVQAELAKGRDPIYFAERILGVRLNRAQKRWFPLVGTDEFNNWLYHQVVHVAANQTGKSLGLAILILWAACYKIGLPTADPKRWLNTPYYGFHVAPQQAQAYIPLGDIRLLVTGSHPAQVDPCRFPAALVQFEKIETGYDGFTTLTGAVVQFRTTDEKAKALQGRRAHFISFDEAAFENHLKVVINEALSMRLISTGGPMWIVSTPNGINDFYEIVEEIREGGAPLPDVDRVWTTDDAALVWSHIDDNVGYGLTAAEVERKERDLDPDTKEQQLRGAFLNPSEAFFVPTDRVLQAFVKGLPEYVEPIDGHRYIVMWDPSISSDPTACYVLDVTRKPWVVVQEIWERKPHGFVWLISRMREVHADRNTGTAKAMTGYDATSMGGKIIKETLINLRPSKAVDFGGGGNKLDILGNLKAALLNGDLIIPEAMVGLKREVVNYRLDDTKIQQDRVMALAGAAHLASKGFSGNQTARFAPSGRIESHRTYAR